ncbi:hypothetical protein HZH68_007981 [Vespula germanica]|uniref:Uncharacterized protein n=1 Tax=Vespula germanica TaxID=30212 RepID=A0A834K6T9_VESGE|nr:hypothetical protein HZH68_007981 [Vespula germanica]
MEKNQRGRIRTKILELGLHVKIWTGSSCLSCPLVPPFAECADTRDRVSGHDGQSEMISLNKRKKVVSVEEEDEDEDEDEDEKEEEEEEEEERGSPVERER